MTAELQQQDAPQHEPPQQVEQPGAEDQANAQPGQDTSADAKPPEGDDKTDKQARRHVNAIQKRIDELTRDRHEERRRAEAAEARAAQLESEFRKAQGAAAKPVLEQFQTYDAYMEALAEWKADQKVAARLDEFAKTNLQTFEQRQHQERAAHAAQQFDRALSVVEQEGVKEFTDFVDVVSNGPNLGPQVGQMVLMTECPHKISYYFAKNPEHGLAIAGMHPVVASREIGKLEAQLMNKRVTQAPPPPRTVGSSDKGTGSGLSDDLSPDEWYRRYGKLLKG